MFSRFKKPESDATRGAATAAVTSPAPAAKLAGGQAIGIAVTVCGDQRDALGDLARAERQ